MSPMSARANPQVWRFPRVSGDEPETPTADQPHYTFSPRERG